MTNEEFDRLWQRAEVEGYAAKLSQEYPVWRAKQRRNSGYAVVLAVMMAVAIPTLMPHHKQRVRVQQPRRHCRSAMGQPYIGNTDDCLKECI